MVIVDRTRDHHDSAVPGRSTRSTRNGPTGASAARSSLRRDAQRLEMPASDSLGRVRSICGRTDVAPRRVHVVTDLTQGLAFGSHGHHGARDIDADPSAIAHWIAQPEPSYHISSRSGVLFDVVPLPHPRSIASTARDAGWRPRTGMSPGPSPTPCGSAPASDPRLATPAARHMSTAAVNRFDPMPQQQPTEHRGH